MRWEVRIKPVTSRSTKIVAIPAAIPVRTARLRTSPSHDCIDRPGASESGQSERPRSADVPVTSPPTNTPARRTETTNRYPLISSSALERVRRPERLHLHGSGRLAKRLLVGGGPDDEAVVHRHRDPGLHRPREVRGLRHVHRVRP